MEINTPPKPLFLVRMVWCWLRLGPQNVPVGTAEAAGGFLGTTSHLPLPSSSRYHSCGQEASDPNRCGSKELGKDDNQGLSIKD